MLVLFLPLFRRLQGGGRGRGGAVLARAEVDWVIIPPFHSPAFLREPSNTVCNTVLIGPKYEPLKVASKCSTLVLGNPDLSWMNISRLQAKSLQTQSTG